MYEKVKKIITDNYNLSKKDIETATQDIIERFETHEEVNAGENICKMLGDYDEDEW